MGTPTATDHQPRAASAGLTLNRVLILAAAAVGVVVLSYFTDMFDPEAMLDPMSIVMSIGLVLAAVLAFRAPAWLYLAAGIALSLIPMAAMAMFAWEVLLHPGLGTEYLAVLGLVAVIVLALPAGIRGFIDARRGTARPARDLLSSRHGLLAGAAVLVLLGMAAAGFAAAQDAKLSAASGGYDVTPEETVTVNVADYTFPETIAVKAGALTEIQLVNEDSAFHTFTYARGGETFNVDLPGGVTASVLVKIDEPGEILFWCTPHSTGPDSVLGEDMAGTMVVG